MRATPASFTSRYVAGHAGDGTRQSDKEVPLTDGQVADNLAAIAYGHPGRCRDDHDDRNDHGCNG